MCDFVATSHRALKPSSARRVEATTRRHSTKSVDYREGLKRVEARRSCAAMLRTPLRPAGFVVGQRSSAFAGAPLRLAAPPRARVVAAALPPIAELERLRLHNLSPAVGSRRPKQRIGRGHSAGQARPAASRRATSPAPCRPRRAAACRAV